MSGALLLGIATFLLAMPAANPLIRWLQSRGITKRIRTDLPASHLDKAGTPTMGGLLFVAVGVIAGLAMLLLRYEQVLWPTLAVAAFGALGAFDDLKGLKDMQGVGWLARSKFPWQWVVAFALALGMYLFGAGSTQWVPLWRQVIDLGVWSIPISAFLIVAWVNATNLTDGLDGLAGGTGTILLVSLATLALAAGHREVGYWTMAFAGGVLAFLWYNVHPARMFMGDVGAEALGAGTAVVALVTGHGLLLVLAGAIVASEALSVMIQVSYFKYTRRKYGEGRRIFRMAPLHHHFEQLGWNEVQVTQRFWIMTGIAAALALALWGIG